MYVNKDITEIIESNSMQFAQYVIKNRALPDLYSGMKPIHSKILWSMFENKTFELLKSRNVAGRVSEYSPHGDCYETIVNMIQNDRHIYNLIEGEGNWGKSTSTSITYAADRYTKCKMSLLGIDCMQGLSKNMVDMIPNYDNSTVMPKHLPTKYPTILTMAGSGIAVGMANSSPSFNLEDICNATISCIDNKPIPMLIPDFATGGYIVNKPKDIENVNLLGSADILLRAKYTIEDNLITITEIPYGAKIYVETIVDKIIEKKKQKQLPEVVDVLNQSGLHGLGIEITARKGTDMNKLMDKLYKLTPLESNFSVNMNVLVNGTPKVLGVHDTIREWVLFRQRCVARGLAFDISELEKELHVLRGLKIVLIDIDKAVSIIRHSKTSKQELMDFFKIDLSQAKYILSLRLENINDDYILKQLSNIEELENKLKSLQISASSTDGINKIIKKELKEVIKKFAQPRRTEIIDPEEATIEITKEDLIDDKTVTICFTRENYIKKNLRYSESQKLKDGDEVLQLVQTTNKSDILLFTNQGRLFIRKAYELEECEPSKQGEYLPNIIDFLPNEKVIYIHATKDWSENLICVFENGNISKMKLTKSKPIQNRKVAIDKIYNTDSLLMSIMVLKDDTDVLLVSEEGKSSIISLSNFNPVNSKNSQGNSGMKLPVENLPSNKVIFSVINPSPSIKFTLTTEKCKTVNYILDKIAPTNLVNEERLLYDYLKGNGNRNVEGKFLINTRTNNDKIAKVVIDSIN